ncbi:AfsR/SARP family transcriptional regulator [Streptomyces solicathayae]|uniref:BTAD domain-containing putative transcriptional regulator n=1 Tax=Streptomyces solicathayae TaxID=3081768 RepID=A0ABZ0M260_9ACTN|nr:BTAD domain-containing putative transcriptional regulator [Streptomyces sp. HUAS YS2]WOX25871.1 BTAD domain-containing putative transcriptional regulator [Streptomyces sp. HUAS YS2]
MSGDGGTDDGDGTADGDCTRARSVAFRTLGPLELRVAGDPVLIGADKQRVLLAMLLAHGGRAVPVAALVREIWGDEPPRSAVANLRTYVMQLRGHLRTARARLTSSRSGYVLRTDDSEFDLPCFRGKVAAARRAVAARRLPEAAELYADALDLWRGGPLEDVTQGVALREFSQHLTESYLSAVEEQVEVETALGREGSVVQRLRHVVALHPLNERLRGRLMVALYGNGDVAGALDSFNDARAALRDELGMDPGEDLCRIHRAVLRRDPSLGRGPAVAGQGAVRGAASGAAGPAGGTGPAPAGPDDGPLASASPGPRAAPGTASGTAAEDAAATRGEPGAVLGPVAYPYAVPRQLPPESTVFVGRQRELGMARAATGGAPAPTVGAPTVVFHGPGGFGKSALALRHAHDLAPLYPDGQLYADLASPAPDGRPPRPYDLVAGFLRALGVPAAQIPDSPAEAVLCYQSAVAGRRLLVVVDNARDAAQVRPLVPANNACAVLATSRSSLPTLLATRVGVRALDETASVRLLALTGTGERFAREHAAALELVRLCGGHPLALRIAGARLVGRPEWSLAGFADRLRDRARRLDELQAEGVSVRACIAESYQQLLRAPMPGRVRSVRAFQLLGLSDRAEFDVADVAGLLGTDTYRAARALDGLVETQLVEPVTEYVFRMHELIRLYAAEVAAPGCLLHAAPSVL